MISCRNGKILPNMCRFRGAQPGGSCGASHYCKDAFTMSCGLPYCMRPLDHVTDNPTVNAMSEAVRPYCKDGKIPTLRDEVRAMGSVPIMFEPGTHWLYGLGSEIVGAIVEVITGKSVRQNMKERLIDPLA